jgi:hypothetical protein
MNMNALPLVGFVLRTESPALAVNIAEFLQPYIGAAWRLSRVMLSIKTMGLSGFPPRPLSRPSEHGILIPYSLIRKRATFTLLEDTAFDIETPTVKRRKYAKPAGNLHGDSFEPVSRPRVEL